MRRRTLTVAALATAVVALVVTATAAADHPGAGGTPFFITATGAQEIPGPGAPLPAMTTGVVRLNSGQEEICFQLESTGFTETGPMAVFAAHIHVITDQPVPGAGPPLVPFPVSPTGDTDTCVFAPRETIMAIRQNPENYYVNLHTRAFPGGAVRSGLCGPGRGQC